MKGQRARRLFAASAVSVLMAGGAAVGLSGTASAATPTHVPTHYGCYGGGFYNGFCNGYGDRGGYFRSGLLNGGGVVVIVLG